MRTSVGTCSSAPVSRPWGLCSVWSVFAVSLVGVLAGCGDAGEGDGASRSSLPAGPWHVELSGPGGALPFGLFVHDDGGVDVVNGSERIRVPEVVAADGGVALRFDVDSVLRLTPGDGGVWTGLWTLERGELKRTEMVARAKRGAGARFGAVAEPAMVGGLRDLAPRYRVEFSQSEGGAVGEFDVGDGGVVEGTFLTPLGDYRYLAGEFDGRRLRLSCFDGAHAFLFDAVVGDDGALSGDFWSRDSWHETWTGVPDSEATIGDGFGVTEVVAGAGGLRYPDLDGEMRSLDDPEFVADARVWIVFGSWCPNCHDAVRLWARLEKKYRGRGLKVLGLAFERTEDLAKERAKVRAFVQRQGVEFPVLVAGLADKGKASEAFPVLDRVRAYPTTVFLGAGGVGDVRAVHTGFSGPATGAAHERLVERFEALVAEMLGG